MIILAIPLFFLIAEPASKNVDIEENAFDDVSFIQGLPNKIGEMELIDKDLVDKTNFKIMYYTKSNSVDDLNKLPSMGIDVKVLSEDYAKFLSDDPCGIIKKNTKNTYMYFRSKVFHNTTGCYVSYISQIDDRPNYLQVWSVNFGTKAVRIFSGSQDVDHREMLFPVLSAEILASPFYSTTQNTDSK